MIFYWVLITYAFVNVSEEVRFVDYMIEVDIATQLMERAWERETSFVDTVKEIIRGNQYDFLRLFYMVSPDYVNERVIPRVAFVAQTILQTQICNSINGLERPTPRPDHLTSAIEHGKTRRKIITAATVIIIGSDLPCGPDGIFPDTQVCYLFALALQRQYIPPNCIKRVENSGETCYFYDVYERMREFYHDGTRYVERNYGDRPEKLLEQLAENAEYTILNPENPENP